MGLSLRAFRRFSLVFLLVGSCSIHHAAAENGHVRSPDAGETRWTLSDQPEVSLTEFIDLQPPEPAAQPLSARPVPDDDAGNPSTSPSDTLATPEIVVPPRPQATPLRSLLRSPLSSIYSPASRQPAFARLSRFDPMFGDSLTPCSTYLSGSGFSNVAFPICLGGRQFKVATNQSPLPQSRVFFNYQFFNDAYQLEKTPGFLNGIFGIPLTGQTLQAIDVNRYTLGGELAFRDGESSLQIQLPVQNSLASTTTFLSDPGNGLPGETETELGNVTLAYKTILYETCSTVVSGGLAIDLPTGSNMAIRRLVPSPGNPSGGDSLRIENDAITLSPFLGVIAAPRDRWAIQGFAQLALPVNDNSFSYTSEDHFLGLPGIGPFTLTETGALNVQALMHLDASLGYRLYESQDCDSTLQSITPMLELHYTTTLEDSDTITFTDPALAFQDNLGSLGNPAGRRDYLNLTAGVSLMLHRTQVRPSLVVPLRTGDDAPFDYEFSLQINRMF